ncbi:hypothetical protein BGZ94_007864 [Podila epigama]|nr:hypothetical protein BGZ94_007864 [Podila epigama]
MSFLPMHMSSIHSLHETALSLKRLVLHDPMSQLEESILFPVLRLCPNLEAILLPQILEEKLENLALVLRDYCPRLKDISITRVPCRDDYLSQLLNIAVREDTLEAVRILNVFIDEPAQLPTGPNGLILTHAAILRHSATLQLLHLGCLGSTTTSKWIQQILSHCHSLQEIRIVHSGLLPICTRDGNPVITQMGRQRRTTPGLDAMDIVHGEPWVCANLRVLEVVIANVPPARDRAPLTELQQEFMLDESVPSISKSEGLAIQQAIYEKIGSLVHLETLILSLHGYYGDDTGSTQIVYPNQHFCLELTLASGLSALGNLKELRELRIQRMEHLMNATEVEWIVHQGIWPKLKQLEGLKNRLERLNVAAGPQTTFQRMIRTTSRMYSGAKFWAGHGEARDDPVTWLRIQRPGLVVDGATAQYWKLNTHMYRNQDNWWS